jgi:hypothetical protein
MSVGDHITSIIVDTTVWVDDFQGARNPGTPGCRFVVGIARPKYFPFPPGNIPQIPARH